MDISAPNNHNYATKIRAGQLLGRCHAAKAEHAMAASALDAALQLAKSGGEEGGIFLLPELLTVRERAMVGIAANGKAPHWVSDRARGATTPLQFICNLPLCK